jgi:hypothetical protein
MVSRADLLVAVIGIVVSVVGSSAALWMAVSNKADRFDPSPLESRIESGFTRLDSKIDGVENRLDGRIDRLDARMDRIEAKLDAVILRFFPGPLPETGSGPA